MVPIELLEEMIHIDMKDYNETIKLPYINRHEVKIPAWASGPSEVLRYFTFSGSPVQDRAVESLRNFRKGSL